MLAPHLANDVHTVDGFTAKRPNQTDLVTLGSRTWRAMSVQVQELENCARHVSVLKPQAPMLLAMLETVGGSIEVRLDPNRASSTAYLGKDHISLIPAGTEVWEGARNVRYMRRVIISFEDQDAIGSDCRLMFADKRVWCLASLLANDVLNDIPLNEAYGAGLCAAISSSLALAGAPDGSRSGLTPRQLKRVTDFVRDNASARIHLRDLAALVGRSPSHFSRAFKVSTGETPHRWVLNFRVAASQSLLIDSSISLAEIALMVGFSDQGHFTRTFKAITGKTPAIWRNSVGRAKEFPSIGASDPKLSLLRAARAFG